MSGRPVDLLFITCNRAAYTEMTLRHLLNEQDDVRVYWWDNASTDGTAELVASLRDPRIVDRFISKENVLQARPTLWFLERSRSDLVGKVDDDTLVPAGWTGPIGSLVRDHEHAGMVGCWTFYPEDFERNRHAAMRKVVAVGPHQVLRDFGIGGTAFLMRRSTAFRYLVPQADGLAFPVHKYKMSCDGLISGWYFPLLWAEHMDDPRSEHCLMNRPGGMNGYAALTARARGFATPEQYQAWIKDDADKKMQCSVRRQCLQYRWRHSLARRILAKVRTSVV